jgi:ABC-2 type transport system permease protein
MNTLRIKTPRAALGKLLLNETRLAWRTPTGLFGGLGLPLLLLIVFGVIPGTLQADSMFGGVSYFSLTFPVLIVASVLTLSIAVLPQSLIQYRQSGVLRRLSVTPMPPAWLLGAQVVINLALVLAGFILLTAAGVVFFSLELPKNIPGFLLVYVLTITSLFAVGLCIAALIKNLPVAQTIGGVLFFGLMFFGGVWIPRPLMLPALRDISDWTPLGASVGSMQVAMQGLFPAWQFLLVLAAYTIVFGYLAVRYFKWE